MEFHVLGQLEVRTGDDAVALGSHKQRALLALLLVHANEVVSTDRIIDELWGEGAGPERQNALWVHVSNLRTALEPGRTKGAKSSVLVTSPPGYLLRVAPDELDAWQFERLLHEGRSLVDADPGAASIAVAEALALWRGRAYETFAYESFAQAEIARLEELRVEAVELRVEADLRRGLASELVGELEALVKQHPLREGFAAQLMTALARSGRRAEALRTYRSLRARLVDELGIDPSAELQRLERQVLEGDPALAERSPGVGAPNRLAVRGYELRDRIGDDPYGAVYRAYQPVVGREVAITVIRPELADDPSFIRRFEAHAEQVARLEHPHIVPLYDYWREPGAAYLVTRLFRRGTLRDLAGEGPLDGPVAAGIVRDVAAALAHAHRHGIVHGDVQPANVLVDDDRRAYITDFSVATEHDVRDDVEGLGRVLAYALGGVDLPPAIADVVARAGRFDDAARFSEAVDAALAAGPPPTRRQVPNPYKGLRAFEEADAADFFGRERLVERLLARLGAAGVRGRFVALVGPSGSGKSSVVHAGVVPALRRGALPGSDGWFVVTMTPGADPVGALASALLRVATHAPPDLPEQVADGPAGVGRAVQAVLPGDDAHLLLVVDQFEELFTQAPSTVASAFLDGLAAAVADPHVPLTVLATLRADLYDRPLGHRATGELLRHGTELITVMSPAELERAITGPAEAAGVRFEVGLVAQILTDVDDRGGALPLLQYALTELWGRAAGGVVTAAAYDEIGGVSGALARRAEGLFRELGPVAQSTARQVLLRLVAVDDDAIARRRVPRRELVAIGDPAVDAVLDAFAAHRLLSLDRDPTTREPTVELAHEALLTAWERLAAWVRIGRDDLRQQRRLAAAAAEWRRAGRDAGYLLQGPALEELTAWAARTELSLAPGERELLAASEARRDEAQRVEDARRRHEAELRRTSRNRGRQLVGAVAALATVAAIAAFAVVQRDEAHRLAGELAAVDEARRLAASSVAVVGQDSELAGLLALQSLEASARGGRPALVEAVDALHWAVQAAGVPYPSGDAPVDVRLGPSGLTGIYRVALPELVAMARSGLDRSFTPEECRVHRLEPCPDAGEEGPVPSEVEGSGPPATSLAGTSVSLSVPGVLPQGLAGQLEAFEERTGIAVDVVAEQPLPGADGLDLAVLAPAAVDQLAERGELVELSTYIDPSAVRRAFGDDAVARATDGTALWSVPAATDVKGLVWYPVEDFRRAGYAVPSSWDELVDLSRRMVTDGRTPWCLGLESGDATGWPATDWVEALVLRLGGGDVYDRWAAHDIPFEHPVVRQATSMLGEIAFGDGFVRGGAASAAERNFLDAGQAMLIEDPPGCWLQLQSTMLLGDELPDDVRLGVDLDFFVLPPVVPGGEAPVFGGGERVVALADRPEVRELVRAMLTPEWATDGAADPEAPSFTPRRDLDPSACRADGVDAAANELRVRVCHVVRDAVDTGSWRDDASDQMPVEIGLLAPNGSPGAFLAAMVDYVTTGPASLDRTLASIDAAWP